MDAITIAVVTEADRLLVKALQQLAPVLKALEGRVMVVGGLMTRLWLFAYPIGLPPRATVDVDLGIDRKLLGLTSKSQVVRPLLEEHGFVPGAADPDQPFRFYKTVSPGQNVIVDLLMAPGASKDDPPLLERNLTSVAAPGLAYGLLRGVQPMAVDFCDGDEHIRVQLPLPHVDAAFVMKAELTRTGLRIRPDRRRVDTVDAVSLASACLKSKDGLRPLKEHARRSDVKGALCWLAESFHDSKSAPARRVEQHFREEFGRMDGDRWAVRVVKQFMSSLNSEGQA
ncbi:hypothetical protein BH23ACT12_BH23ACT12_07110 [soil metagenome]